MKCVDVFSTMLLAFQATPSEGSIRPRSQGSTCSGLLCAKMASTMAAVLIDPSGPVSFFKRKLVRNKERLVCHYLASILWHFFVSLYDEMSHCCWYIPQSSGSYAKNGQPLVYWFIC